MWCMVHVREQVRWLGSESCLFALCEQLHMVRSMLSLSPGERPEAAEITGLPLFQNLELPCRIAVRQRSRTYSSSSMGRPSRQTPTSWKPVYTFYKPWCYVASSSALLFIYFLLCLSRKPPNQGLCLTNVNIMNTTACTDMLVNHFMIYDQFLLKDYTFISKVAATNNVLDQTLLDLYLSCFQVSLSYSWTTVTDLIRLVLTINLLHLHLGIKPRGHSKGAFDARFTSDWNCVLVWASPVALTLYMPDLGNQKDHHFVVLWKNFDSCPSDETCLYKWAIWPNECISSGSFVACT